MCRHTPPDVNLNSLRATVRKLNKLLLDGVINPRQYTRIKADLLRLVAISHQPVIANLFIL